MPIDMWNLADWGFDMNRCRHTFCISNTSIRKLLDVKMPPGELTPST